MKKLTHILFTTLIVYNSIFPTVAYALTVDVVYGPPAPPVAPSAPTPPAAPTPAYVAPTSIPEPTKVPKPTEEDLPDTPKPTKVKSSPTPTQSQVDSEPSPTAINNTETSNYEGDNSGSQSNNDNSEGSVDLTSGDIEGSVNVSNAANNNSDESGNGSGGNSYGVDNSGNGADSTNNGEITDEDTTNIDQNNDLGLNNNVDVDYDTGGNKINDNLGGESSIKTGDATSTVNIFNFANTNLIGADISSNEFNVADNQSGDIDLTNAGSQSCAGLVGCSSGNSGSVNNAGNGSGSLNDGTIKTGNNIFITTDNFANVDNSINIDVETGDNTIADSLGDASIETGDANVVANIFNFLNNSFVSLTDLVINTVNILGDFAGNILLPNADGSVSSYAVNNAGNGTDSVNSGEINTSDTLDIAQNNDAVINNTITLDANTGANRLADNINGEGDTNSITTGKVNTSATATTVANQNFVGNDLNIVFLNKGGVLQAFYLNHEGDLIPISYETNNEGNGSGSTNNAAIVEENNTSIDQTNVAVVNNNINVTADTGNNKIADNIDGSTSIKTGDVNLVSSITNFVNNNFAGGRVIFTVVNDFFNKWTGGFIKGGNQSESNTAPTPTIAPQVVQQDGAGSEHESPAPQVAQLVSVSSPDNASQPTSTVAPSPTQALANANSARVNGSNIGTVAGAVSNYQSIESQNGTPTPTAATLFASKLAKKAATSQAGDTSDMEIAGFPTLNPFKVATLIAGLLFVGVYIARKRFIAV